MGRQGCLVELHWFVGRALVWWCSDHIEPLAEYDFHPHLEDPQLLGLVGLPRLLDCLCESGEHGFALIVLRLVRVNQVPTPSPSLKRGGWGGRNSSELFPTWIR